MKQFCFLLILITYLPLSAVEFSLSSEVRQKAPFIAHTTPGQWSSYLVQNIRYEPVKALFLDLDKMLGGTLNKNGSRTEAHITVITPTEFDQVLKEKVLIEEIHEIALAANVQDSSFDILCLGEGEALVEGKKQQTYYLVVKSANLMAIRKTVFDLFKSRGGNVSQFDPDLFYPHITVGYTVDDLHLEKNGVKKGTNSCFADILIR